MSFVHRLGTSPCHFGYRSLLVVCSCHTLPEYIAPFELVAPPGPAGV